MNELFKILSVLKLIAELRGHAHRGRGSYRRSHQFYPLYGRPRRSLIERLLHRYLSRRSY